MLRVWAAEPAEMDGVWEMALFSAAIFAVGSVKVTRRNLEKCD